MSSGEEQNGREQVGRAQAGRAQAGPPATSTTPGAGRVVFRLPPSSLIFAVVLLFCVIPLAGVGGWWSLMYVVPVAAVAWTLLTRTVVDPRGITVRTWLGSKKLAWQEVVNLELTEARWTVALDVRGGRTRLPMVLPRDLPALAAASGGAIRFEMPPAESDSTAEA
ncbi:PH domain-containing protein [Nakamurella sp. A5-74]|uniref:PH domain-containing protein n=1 Tax=Nakamurella sp. A5-74 TaxID=3158264 RepID=A0AAU8DSQ6_9ACTN